MKMQCSFTAVGTLCDLSENGPRRVIRLKARSLVSGSVWEGLGGVAFGSRWSCQRRCVTAAGSEVSKAHARPALLLPTSSCGSGWEVLGYCSSTMLLLCSLP